MKSTFASAAVVGMATASPLGKLQNDPQFIQYINQNNKNYHSVTELGRRAGIFQDNQAKINGLNATSARTGKSNAATYGMNQFGDMTDDEFVKTMTGMQEKNPADRTTLGYVGGRRRGGLGVVDATAVDHVASGAMGAVKDQGNCGSCWAFAANSALEGYIAHKNQTAPVRLSEQHLVDCTLRNNSHNMDLFGEDFGLWGCGGGWMATAWYFQSKHGVITDEVYPYTSGNTSTESRCAHDSSKIIGKV